jgi:serine/threonine protein kinase
MYGLYKQNDQFFLVMEYLPLGSLDEFLENNTMLDKTELGWMCFHVARGMAYLHSKDILHNDLAARNLLVTKNDFERDGKYLLKVSDFGLSFTASKGSYVYGSTEAALPVR